MNNTKYALGLALILGLTVGSSKADDSIRLQAGMIKSFLVKPDAECSNRSVNEANPAWHPAYWRGQIVLTLSNGKVLIKKTYGDGGYYGNCDGALVDFRAKAAGYAKMFITPLKLETPADITVDKHNAPFKLALDLTVSDESEITAETLTRLMQRSGK